MLTGTLGCFSLLAGCATAPGANPADPYEDFNRSMYNFNDGLDKALLKPAALAYQTVTPTFVRAGVGNFFGNLSEPWVAVNAALQGKVEATVATLMRFTLNTVAGFYGLIDVASALNIGRRNEDFGQTLGFWGVKPGPYLMLPLLGPTTVRDGFGLVVDFRGDPLQKEVNLTTRDSLSVLRLVDFRASLLRAGDLLGDAALDKYLFTRDVFLQRRQALVYDGQEPPDADDEQDSAPTAEPAKKP